MKGITCETTSSCTVNAICAKHNAAAFASVNPANPWSSSSSGLHMASSSSPTSCPIPLSTKLSVDPHAVPSSSSFFSIKKVVKNMSACFATSSSDPCAVAFCSTANTCWYSVMKLRWASSSKFFGSNSFSSHTKPSWQRS